MLLGLWLNWHEEFNSLDSLYQNWNASDCSEDAVDNLMCRCFITYQNDFEWSVKSSLNGLDQCLALNVN